MKANEKISSLQEGAYVRIRSTFPHTKYITALPDGNLEFKDSATANSTFQLVKKGKSKWAFRSTFNQYLSAVAKDLVLFATDTPLRREEFFLDGQDLSDVYFYSKFHAFYVVVSENEKGLECNFALTKEASAMNPRSRFQIELVQI